MASKRNAAKPISQPALSAMAPPANNSDSESTGPDMPCLEVVKNPGMPDLEQVEDTWYFDQWNYFREGFTWWTKEKDTGVWKPVHEKTKWWFDSTNYYGSGFRWWIKESGRWKRATESSIE